MARARGRDTIIEIGNMQPLDGNNLYAESSIRQYLEILYQDRVSWILFDGSIVQINYKIRGQSIIAHRYCYIPAPFDLDLRSANYLDATSVIEASALSDPLGVTHRSALRFEYDPDAQTEEHAAAHLHLNTPNCRIPMRAAINVREFVYFVLSFFYEPTFSRAICGQIDFNEIATITEGQKSMFHINWQRRLAQR